MAGNGLVHTVASVVSPAAGAWLAATIGFSRSFAVLGWVLLATGIASLAFVREPTAKPGAARTPANGHQPEKPHAGALPNTPLAYAHAAGGAPGKKGGSPAAAHVSSGPSYAAASPFPWAIFILPVSLACAQGILSFELPLRELGADSGHSVMTTGLLFSVVSLGALATLCLLFLNRYLPYARTMAGASLLAICYYGLATGWPIPLTAMLFAIGMAKGVIFPAMTSFLLQLSGTDRYGRTFSLLSISLSVGAFLGPVAAGAVRPHFSPYFLSFLALMIAVALLFPRPSFRENWRVGSPLPPVSDPS